MQEPVIINRIQIQVQIIKQIHNQKIQNQKFCIFLFLISNSVCVCVCTCVLLVCSVMSDSCYSHGLQPARLLSPLDFPCQQYWSGLPFPSPGDLPNPGIEPASLVPLASIQTARSQFLFPSTGLTNFHCGRVNKSSKMPI